MRVILAAGRLKSSARKGTQKDGDGNMDVRDSKQGKIHANKRKTKNKDAADVLYTQICCAGNGFGIIRCGRKLVGVDLFRNEHCDWLMAS